MAVPVAIVAGLQAANQGFQLANSLLNYFWTTSLSPDAERLEKAKKYVEDFNAALAVHDVAAANLAHNALLGLLQEAIAVRVGAGP